MQTHEQYGLYSPYGFVYFNDCISLPAIEPYCYSEISGWVDARYYHTGGSLYAHTYINLQNADIFGTIQLGASVMSSFTILAFLNLPVAHIPREVFPFVVMVVGVENM